MDFFISRVLLLLSGVPFRNGHIPTGNSSCLSPDRPLHVHVADNMTEYSDEKSSLGGDRR